MKTLSECKRIIHNYKLAKREEHIAYRRLWNCKISPTNYWIISEHRKAAAALYMELIDELRNDNTVITREA